MGETAVALFAEATAEPGDMFTAAKAGHFGVMTSIEREIIAFAPPESEGNAKCCLRYRTYGTIYDYIWHPTEDLHLLLQKDFPVSLQSHARTLKTYPVSNHLDEVKSPIAACFCTPQAFYTGLGNRVFRYDVETTLFSTVALVPKGIRCSPKTIVSAIATSGTLVAAGTYSKVTYILCPDSKTTVAILEGHVGGVIQCSFEGEWTLYTGGRADNTVLAWDLRVPSSPVNAFCFYRTHLTQQRVIFSVNDREVRLGNADGSVYIYSAVSGELQSGFNAHFDAINSVQSSADFPLITSSGQRHFPFTSPPLSCLRWWRKVPDVKSPAPT